MARRWSLYAALRRTITLGAAFLTGNYRSTGHIITAANAVIEPARQRMKAGNPIEIDRARRRDPPGGAWTLHDPVAQGRVQILPVGTTPSSQSQAAVSELKRLAGTAPDWKWATCAVIAREWNYLDPVRTLCELDRIPVQMANEEFSGVWHLRETRGLVKWLRERDYKLVSSTDVSDWLVGQPDGRWIELLQEAIAEYALETGGEETPVGHVIEWLAEWSREVRKRQQGLLLLTAHRAKGLEFDHVVVLDGGWDRANRGEDADAPRRLYYVAMTRARHTLTLARFPGPHHLQDALKDVPAVLQRDTPAHFLPAAAELQRRYRRLSLRDVFLSFAGYHGPNHPIHHAIASLSPGDPLHVRVRANRWELVDSNGMVVGQLAAGFEPPAGMQPTLATVWAIAIWDRERSDPQFREGLQCDSWEVVVPELVFEPA